MNNRATNTLSMEMDVPTLTAVLGATGIAVAALFTGFWKWMTSRGKISIDAQASVINGFILLLGEFKLERAELVSRIGRLETENHGLYRHIAKLERAMRAGNVAIPDGDSDGDDG